MKKKTLAMILTLLMVFGLFAGCTQTDDPGSEPQETEKEFTMLPKDKTYRVLFIGNSLTEYNKMYHTYFESFAQSSGYDMEVTAITHGGYKLEWFADSEDTFGAKVAQALDGSQKYDYVILQENGLLPSTNATAFYDSARKLVDMVRAIGAQPVFYCTFARRDGNYEMGKNGMTNETMTWKTAAAYTAIGEELDVPVVYVGLVMYELNVNTGVEIYDGDLLHPSATGSAVIALTLFSDIFGVDPTTVALPDYLSDWDIQQIQEAVRTVVSEPPEIPEEYRVSSEGVTAKEG